MTLRTFGASEHRAFTPGDNDPAGPGWMDDATRRLSPDSIAETYLYLHSQDPSSWTLELDLRPAKVRSFPPFAHTSLISRTGALLNEAGAWRCIIERRVYRVTRDWNLRDLDVSRPEVLLARRRARPAPRWRRRR